jgi:small subunit ribosomal protein S27Ae
MAAKGKEAPKASGKKKTIGVKRWEMYKNGKVENRECPKCGNQNYMADHKDRHTCGKCGYTEFKNKQ